MNPPASLRVVVADDDDVDRERMSRILHRLGALEVDLVGSGDALLERLRSARCDVVFLDHHLGDTLGAELLDHIRMVHPDPCAVVLVTGQSSERLAVDVMRRGARDYVSKRGLTREVVQRILDRCREWVDKELELNQANARLRRLSLYDDLTGLPNRAHFFDELERAFQNLHRHGVPVAVAVGDLNLFKEINDTYGHDAGDHVLRTVGARFAALARDTDTAARLGGDEFAFVFTGVQSVADAERAVSRYAEALGEPIAWNGVTLRVRISMGVAIAPRDGREARAVLQLADHAMYTAKRDRVGFHASGQPRDHHAVRAARVVSALPAAVRDGQVSVHYQPQVSLDALRPVAVEALVRWVSPELGYVRAGEFIPLVESSEVLGELTRAVLRRVASQHALWRRQGLRVPMAVNISAHSLQDPQFHRTIDDALRLSGMDPRDLTLEITETAIVANPTLAVSALRPLVDRGVRVAIDDFGAGFTSLRLLRDLPVHELKIDKTFVPGIDRHGDDATIVRSLVVLAEGLGVRCVAEGVERPGTARILADLGVGHAQGFLLGRPMRGVALRRWWARTARGGVSGGSRR